MIPRAIAAFFSLPARLAHCYNGRVGLEAAIRCNVRHGLLWLENTANGTNIIFIAERAETQDLMRRKMEFLHQQFKNLGHENLTFTFTSPQDQAHGDGDHSEDTETLKSNETEMLLAVNLPVSSGLDIRI